MGIRMRPYVGEADQRRMTDLVHDHWIYRRDFTTGAT